jgi:hypothetical protein
VIQKLLLGSFLTLSLLLHGCEMFDPDAPSDKCAGLQRQLTLNKNTNSYNRTVLQSQRFSLEQQYKALNCSS